LFHKIRWTVSKIAQRLQLIAPLVYRRRAALPPFRYLRLDDPLDQPPVGIEVDDSTWMLIQPKAYWGARYENFVMRTRFRIPPEWDDAAPVALHLPLGDAPDLQHPEALAYIDGVAYATRDRNHIEIPLPTRWHDGQAHLLALHGYVGGWDVRHNVDFAAQLQMGECALVQIDQPTRDFIATARVALLTVEELDENNPTYTLLLNALNDAFIALDTREPFGDDFYASVPAAHAVLRAGIAKAGAALPVEVIATGHAHIDTAWLWTLGQTRRKIGRSWHTVLRLMEQFPGYHFSASQPQHYEYARQDYPELFEAIKARVHEGRWEALGGMWIEADCNLSGLESLCRQFLYGRLFFREHFGAAAESPVLWLPDVFGYSWNLPQLIKQAGMDYFFTIKIGWSQYNRLPYDSFWWQGIDGTKVLTHFSPVPEEGAITNRASYNALLAPRTAWGAWFNYQQKAESQEMLMSFGFGDGGGGPTREMLENMRELADFPGMPRVRPGGALDFFRQLEANAGDKLPVYNGELYLEYHRGTYTTQARSKRANRKSEVLLHDAEFLATLASLIDPAYEYPYEAFREAWKLVLLNQFHDIIPGTSIRPVYEESMQQYERVRELGEAAKQAALQVIAAQTGGDLLLVDTTGMARPDLVYWEGRLAPGQVLRYRRAEQEITFATQPAAAGGTWIAPVIHIYNPDTDSDEGYDHEILDISVLTIEAGEPFPLENQFTVTPTLLENSRLRVELDANGDITRIFDKNPYIGREVLPPGGVANQLQLFEDRPMKWDAWDIDRYYDDRMWTAEPAESVSVLEAGPLRGTIEIRRRIGNSTIVQRISLQHGSSRLDFETVIDWRERHMLLKAAFPVTILSPVATYEIQGGHVERPTHYNTSWDWARFETCAQRWVHLAEGNYSVGLMSDCKYGYDVHDNVLRISLLRSPTFPDPEADQGEHRFTYSLYPSDGASINGVYQEAVRLNYPILVYENRQPFEQVQHFHPFARLFNKYFAALRMIHVETIKRAEDGEGIIVRFYERERARRKITAGSWLRLKAAYITNLLEENQTQLEIIKAQADDDVDHFELEITPFQLVTLRLIPE
jgi:alpha-mannosidase